MSDRLVRQSAFLSCAVPADHFEDFKICSGFSLRKPSIFWWDESRWKVPSLVQRGTFPFLFLALRCLTHSQNIVFWQNPKINIFEIFKIFSINSIKAQRAALKDIHMVNIVFIWKRYLAYFWRKMGTKIRNKESYRLVEHRAGHHVHDQTITHSTL